MERGNKMRKLPSHISYRRTMREKTVIKSCKAIMRSIRFHWGDANGAVAELADYGYSATVCFDPTGGMYMGMVHTHKHGVVSF